MKTLTSSERFSSSPIKNDNSTEDYSTTLSPSAPSAPSAQSRNQSIIGGNIKFRGELIGTEDLHIEGTVEGTVIMEGHSLTVGSEGVVNANIHASNITINGQLTGDILADELISIKDSAVVKGNLIAPRIQLDDGGKFRGSMDMIDNDQEKKDRTDAFKEKLVHPHLPNHSIKAKPVPSIAKTITNEADNQSKNNQHKNNKKQ